MKEEAAKTRPLTFEVTSFDEQNVIIKGEYRVDALEVFKTTVGRLYRGMTQENSIPIGYWIGCRDRLLALPNVTITYRDDIEQRIEEALFAPLFRVALETTIITVKPHRRAATYGIRDIPGCDWNYSKNFYTMPKSEGWRLWEFLERTEQTDSAHFTEEARDFLIQQVSKRKLLDALGKQIDCDDFKIDGFKGELKGYQKVSVKFGEYGDYRFIIADAMGLGKSPSAIATILHGGFKAVIVCPASLRTNWIRQIRKFTDAKPYLLTGTTPNAYDVVHLIKEKPQFVIINYDILSVAHTETTTVKDTEGHDHVKHVTLYPWIEVFKLAKYDIVVFDEAHYMKNVDSKRSQAGLELGHVFPHVIALTGTPVMNRPSELWPLLNLVDPSTYPAFQTFVRQYTVDGKKVRNVSELHTALKPVMIRRLHKDVYTQLPSLNRIEEYTTLEGKAKKLYDRVLGGVYEVVSTWNPHAQGATKEVTNILVQIQRLKQICAIAKVESTADLAVRIYDSSQPDERPNKVLIFSQFKPTAYKICQLLGDEAIGFVSYNPKNKTDPFKTPDSTERMKLVDRFQNDPSIHYLVVTEKTATEGLDITAAMAVIFNDLFWTPSSHNQAEGRAWMRTSDPHGIDSYYNMCEDTIDEWIWELLAGKLAVINQTVDAINDTRADESIAMELIKRMKEGLWLSKKK